MNKGPNCTPKVSEKRPINNLRKKRQIVVLFVTSRFVAFITPIFSIDH
jgi:hypothetical protein